MSNDDLGRRCAGCGTKDVDWCERCAEQGNDAAVAEAIQDEQDRVIKLISQYRDTLNNSVGQPSANAALGTILAALREKPYRQSDCLLTTLGVDDNQPKESK